MEIKEKTSELGKNQESQIYICQLNRKEKVCLFVVFILIFLIILMFIIFLAKLLASNAWEGFILHCFIYDRDSTLISEFFLLFEIHNKCY